MTNAPTRGDGNRWRARLSVAGLLLVLALLGLAPWLTATAGAADDFGQREPGRHVYDRAGLLTADEVRDLEARATAAERAGAPTIVYLRVQKADEGDTKKDARELMDVWGVESAPDARDGLVIFLNLKPGDERHGQAAIWAGARHTRDGGNLPQYELTRVYDDVMRPLLADGRTAAGIDAGLATLTNSLTVGAPPPPDPGPAYTIARSIAGLPLTIVALLIAGVTAFVASRAWGARPQGMADGTMTLRRPGDLPPALVGALVARRLDVGPLTEATILDLARRGALAIEPEGPKKVSLRLLDQAKAGPGFERDIWAGLATIADQGGLIASKQLGKIAKLHKGFALRLRDELTGRGWYDPGVGARRVPLYIAGTVALVAAGLGFIPAAIGEQPWAVPGIALLFIVGLGVLMMGGYLPETTAAGETAAAPWHAYKAGIKAAAKDRQQALDLDAILPDAVAFGLSQSLDGRLKEASKQGYTPSWFARQAHQGDSAVLFYPYWVAFHGGVSPSSVSTGGGASAGGAGAGGSF